MKKKIILLLLIFCSYILYAQKISLSKAYNAYYERDFFKAKELIDQCSVDVKLSEKAQTWLYKGNIYLFLANNEYNKKQNDTSYIISYPNSPVTAYDAFVKAEKLDKNIEAYDMRSPKEGKEQLYPLLMVWGVEEIINKDYRNAKNTLEKAIICYEIKVPPGFPLNGELYYYYAYTLEMLERYEEAINYYEKAIGEGSSNVNVFLRIIEYYKSQNNSDKVYDIITKAKDNLPDNVSIRVAEIEYWLNIDSVKAVKMISSLPQSIYDVNALVNLANLNIKLKQYEKASELLEKANSLSQNNFIIYYNLGYCYLKLYEDNFLRGNELAVKGNNTESGKYMQKSKIYLDDAEKYFEQASNFDNKDLSILEQLKEIYARKQSPKYDNIVKQIEALKNK